MRTASEVNVDAEVRAVEEGHRAQLAEGGGIEVVSDTRPGKRYRVEFYAISGDPIVFACEPVGPPDGGHHALRSSVAGVVTCKHAATAARRLERERLAVFVDGLWISVAGR